ncbi:MAG: hypothetical protein SynsKO_27350 [Synoicihabitans sp.]
MGSALAQTPPSDLTELSLEQLLGLRIIPHHAGLEPTTSTGSKWSIAQSFLQFNFDGNCDGTRELPVSEVLWSGIPAERTMDNFPIVPLIICQKAYVSSIAYDASERWRWNVLLPYIVQETDHVANDSLPTISAEFARFIIRSEGIGDITVNPSYVAYNQDGHTVTLHTGMSLPVGSITEHGDTPAPGRSNQLPYTMQIGSGTFDYLPGITYVRHHGNTRWGAQALATIRLGRNDRGYSLGDRLSLSTWVRTRPVEWLEPFVNVSAQAWGRIDGVDEDFTQYVGGFFPATVTDPSKYGGEKITITGGLNFVGQGKFTNQSLEISFGAPVYQRLNGPQPREVWRLGVSWGWDL